MGTWGIGSQWCNRLLWIIVILKGRLLFWERESERERGDEARLAFEEDTRRPGAGRLFWLMADPYKHAQPPLIGILLP
jgi:hypothetical protein